MAGAKSKNSERLTWKREKTKAKTRTAMSWEKLDETGGSWAAWQHLCRNPGKYCCDLSHTGFIIMKKSPTEMEKQSRFALRKKTFEEIHEEKQKVLGRKTMRKQEQEGREGLRRTSARYRSVTRRPATGAINNKISKKVKREIER